MFYGGEDKVAVLVEIYRFNLKKLPFTIGLKSPLFWFKVTVLEDKKIVNHGKNHQPIKLFEPFCSVTK